MIRAYKYTRLRLKVSDKVDIKKIKYDLKDKELNPLVNDQTFDEKGNSNIYDLSTRNDKKVIYYIRDTEGALIKRVSAKALTKRGVASSFNLKTTKASVMKDPNTIKKTIIDTTEVGWMIAEKDESIKSFLNKIYEQKPTDKEDQIFRANNAHLLTPVMAIHAGDFVILSNTSNSSNKELVKMKEDAKAAKAEFNKVKEEFGFNPEMFASNADFLHSMLRTVDYVSLTKDKVKNVDKPSKGVDLGLIAAMSAGTSQGIVNFAETSNAKVTEAYTRLVEAYEDVRKTTYDSSGKPIKSKLGNPKKFNSFRQTYPKLIKDFDNAFAQSFFKYETGLTAKNIRKQVKNDVMIRSSRYEGGIKAYAKNFMKLGKMTKITEGGGNILVAVSVADSTMTVKDAYDSGDSDHTRKTIITETLKLEGGLAGGWLGGAGGAALATAVIGAGTGGIGLIVIGVVAAGSGVAEGILGSEFGGFAGDVIGDEVNKLL